MTSIILDLDNCTSNDEWRIPKINWEYVNPMHRYHDYHMAAIHDRVANVDLFTDINHDILVFTARPVLYRSETVEWLNHNGINFKHLLMRGVNDHSKSVVLKQKQLFFMRDRYGVGLESIVCAYDDRPDIVRMYIENGVNAEVRSIHSTCAYTKPEGIK